MSWVRYKTVSVGHVMSKLLISKRQTFIFGKLTYRRSGDGADDKTGPLTSPHFQLVILQKKDQRQHWPKISRQGSRADKWPWMAIWKFLWLATGPFTCPTCESVVYLGRINLRLVGSITSGWFVSYDAADLGRKENVFHEPINDKLEGVHRHLVAKSNRIRYAGR